MAIEDIQVGDFVWSENPETGEKALKEVANTFAHVKDTLVYVTINDEVIETTREHPFWIEGQGWTAAEFLKFGDVVRFESGENVAIDNVEVNSLDEYIKVYNFEVEDFHTYYVSNDDVLVHNVCKVKPYEVGNYNKLKAKSISGDNLDIHHAVQKHPAGQVIAGYNPKTAPSIAVPKDLHLQIPNVKGAYNGNARDLLAQDIKNLRKYTDAPNSSLRDLISLNKSMYPDAFKK